jgi:hypothetical protein
VVKGQTDRWQVLRLALFHLREIDDLAGSGGRPNNSPILTQIKVPTSGDFVLKPVSTRECEAADESGSVCTQHCCSNNCAQHPNQSPKLSVVRVLRWQRRGRNELRVYDISAMLGHGEWDRGLLQSEYAIRATTRAASIDEDKTLSVLNPQTQLRLTLTQSRHGRVDLQGTSTVSGIVHAEATIPPFSITHVIGHSHVNTGWTVGYGTEGKLLIPGWTLKAEYLYVDLGTLDDNDPPPPTTISVLGGGQTFTHTHFTDNIIRVGLNYQFH